MLCTQFFEDLFLDSTSHWEIDDFFPYLPLQTDIAARVFVHMAQSCPGLMRMELKGRRS